MVANNPHSSGIIVAYLPAEKILIEVDLYAPGPVGAPPLIFEGPAWHTLSGPFFCTPRRVVHLPAPRC